MDITERSLSMPEMSAIVEDGARKFEAVEKKLDTAHRQALSIIKTIEDGHGEQMTGALNAGRMKNNLRAAAGKIGEALALIYATHQECTEIAKAHNVDIPVIMGGGDR